MVAPKTMHRISIQAFGTSGGQLPDEAAQSGAARAFDTRIAAWLKNAVRTDAFATPNAILTEGGLGTAQKAAGKLMDALRAESLHDMMTLGGYRTGSVRVVGVAELKSKNADQLESYFANAAGSIIVIADAEKLAAPDAEVARAALQNAVKPGTPVNGDVLVMLQTTKEGAAQLAKDHAQLTRGFRVV